LSASLTGYWPSTRCLKSLRMLKLTTAGEKRRSRTLPSAAGQNFDVIDKSGPEWCQGRQPVGRIAPASGGFRSPAPGCAWNLGPEVGVGWLLAVRDRRVLVRGRLRGRLLDEGAYGPSCPRISFLLADSGDGTGAVEAGLRNAGTRDDYGFDVTAALRLRRKPGQRSEALTLAMAALRMHRGISIS